MRLRGTQLGIATRSIVMACLLLLAASCHKNSGSNGPQSDGPGTEGPGPDSPPPVSIEQGIALEAPQGPAGEKLTGFNLQVASAVSFRVQVAAGYGVNHELRLTITDPAGSSITVSRVVPPNGGVVVFANVDLSGLADGTLRVVSELMDSNGDVLVAQATNIPLDKTPPPLPTAYQVISEVVSVDPFMSRPANMVTLGNAHSALIRISFGFDADPATKYRLVVSDGVDIVEVAEFEGPRQPGNLEWRVDLRALPDGPLTLAGEGRDDLGNTVVFGGQTIIKDTLITATQAPVVLASINNPEGVVNERTASSVSVLVTPGQESLPDDRFQLVISDGIESLTSALQQRPSPNGPLYFTNLDLSSLDDGPIELTVRSLDIHGNATASPMAQAQKDTFLAAIADVTHIGPTTLNAAAAAAASFSALRDPLAVQGDALSLFIEDGVHPAIVLEATLDSGPGSQVLGSIDLSGLNEGVLKLRARTTDSAGNSKEIVLGSIAKDAFPPLPPVRVRVQSTANNPRDYINAASDQDVLVGVISANEMEPGRKVKLQVTQGAFTNVLEQSAEQASQLVPFSGIDLSGLIDGLVTFTIWHEDTLGNSSTQVNGSAIIDRIAAVPFGVIIPAGPGGVGNTIDPSNVNSVNFDLFFGPNAEGSDIVSATLTDGAMVISIPTSSPPQGGGTLSISGIDASSLSDGGVVISGTTLDLAGNVGSFGPFSFNKDTTPPALPNSFRIASGAQNGPDLINASSYLNVILEVQWPTGISGNEMATYTLTDTVGTMVSFGPQNPPAGGGTVTVGPFNTASLQDGPITLSLRLTETSGNTVNGSGTPAVKDIVPPAAALGAGIPMAAGHPANIINISNSTATSIEVTLGSNALSTETVAVTLTDSLFNAISTSSLLTPAGAGTLTFFPVDVSTLADGTINLSVAITDPVGNVTTSAGTQALKDTVTVASPIAKVASTAQNQDHYINSQSVAAVLVEVTVPGTYMGNESVRVELRDSASGLVSSGTMTAPAGGVLSFSGLDCTALLDGVISIETIVTDSALNTSSHSGSGAIKDTVAPTAPTSVNIASGTNNAQDQINLASSSNVSIDVAFDASMAGNETLDITLTGPSAATVPQAMLNVPFGGGLVSFSAFNANPMADGAISLSGSLKDPAGNETLFAGTSGTKDTVAPTPPNSLNVPAGTNNPIHFINIATESAPAVEAVWASGSEASNTLVITLTGGSTTASVAGANVPAGAGTATFPGLDAQAFPEGLISITLVITDDHGNEITTTGTSATKDTTAPNAPIYTRVEMTANNPRDFVNLTTVGAIQIDVSLGAGQGFSTTDSVMVNLTDGASTTISSSVANAGSNGGINSFTVNGSTLAEGALTLETSITDEAGNEATFAGTSATLDLTNPVAPVSINVKSGSGNGVNIINNQNSGGVLLDVVWDATTTSAYSFTVTFTSSAGGMPITLGPVSPSGPGADTIGPFDLAALTDGSITIGGILTDPSGNTTTVTGTTAIKSTGAPDPPNDAYVAGSANNPRDFINAATQSAVSVDVEFDGSSIPGNTVGVILSDGMNTASSTTQVTAGGAETMVFTVNTSGLNDGPLTLRVDVVDTSMSLTTFTGTAATKDVQIPIVPNRAEVAATAQNPVHFINDTTKAVATVEVDLSDASYVGGEMVSIVLTDQGMLNVSAGPVARSAMSSLVTFAGLNCTTLADGPITMQVTITDPAQNSMTYAGAVATKDIVAPLAPSSVAVAAGPNNAANFINNRNQGDTKIAVTWDASMIGSESAVVQLTDSMAASLNSATYMGVPNGGGAEAFTFGASTSLADGAIALQVTLTDAAGNVTVSAGTAATKATVAPVGPTSVHVLATAMVASQDIINAGNFTNFTVRAVFPGTSAATNTVTVRLEDSSSGLLQSSTLSAPAGAANLDFAGLDATSLGEGLLSLSVLVESTDQNLTTVVGGTTFALGLGVYKDTILPAAPTTFKVPLTSGNPEHWISATTLNAARVSVTLPSSYDGTESFVVNMADSVSPSVSSTSANVAAGGGTTTVVLNPSTLQDGTLTMTLDVVDGGENSRTFNASVNPRKDTVLPALAEAYVLGGFTNARNVINGNNEAAVTVRTVWGATVDSADFLELSFDDGINSAVVAMASAPNSAGNADVTSIDVSPLDDGLITFRAVATDAAGNTTTLTGATVGKKSGSGSTRYAYTANDTADSVGIYLASDDGILHPQGFALAGDSPISLATDYLARWLYVANLNSGTITAYSITDPKGLLQPIGDFATGVQPFDIAVDCHGRFLFNTNLGSSTVTSFVINQSTGALAGATTNAAGANPAKVTLHDNGLYAFVVDLTGNAITSHSIDQTTGAFGAIGSAPCSSNPVDFAIHPNGLWGYAAVSGSAEVRAFDISTSGVLTPGAAVGAGTSPVAIAIHPTGNWALVAHTGSSDIYVYSINASSGALTVVGAPVPAGTTPTDIEVSNSGLLVYVPSNSTGEALSFDFDPATGALTPNTDATTQAGPRSIALAGGENPIGFVLRYAPVVNKVSADIAVHEINDMTGALTPVGTAVSTGTMSDPVALLIHPSNQWLFSANNADNTIGTFSFDLDTGAVAAFGTAVNTGGLKPASMTLDLSGRFLYVVNTDSNDLQAFSINQTTGALTAVGSPVSAGNGSNPIAIVAHPLGGFLFTANSGTDSMSVFTINAQTGAATASATGVPATNGVVPNDVRVHPTGQWLYLVSRGSGTVETYNIDPSTGALSFASSAPQGGQPSAMVIDASGAYAYVVSKSTGAVQAYTINSTTGALATIGAPMAAGSDSRSLAIDPRTDFLYVGDFASGGTSTINVFTINDSTGVLTSAGSQAVNGMGTNALQLVVEVQ